MGQESENGGLMSGYLKKMPVKKQRKGLKSLLSYHGKQWKNRFFVLTESSLAYYESDPRPHFKFQPKGDIHFDDSTTVREYSNVYAHVPAFSFCVITQEKMLVASAKSAREMKEWIKQIKEICRIQHKMQKGYLMKQAVLSKSNWKKRYFVLNGDSLDYCENEYTTAQIKGSVKLNGDCYILNEDHPSYSHAFRVCTGQSSIVLAGFSEFDKTNWVTAFQRKIFSLRLSASSSDSTTRGYLEIKKSNSNKWEKHYCEINDGAFIIKKEEHRERVLKEIEILPNSGVVPSNVHPFSFTFVQSGEETIYLASYSESEMNKWITSFNLATQKAEEKGFLGPVKELACKILKKEVPLKIAVKENQSIGIVCEQYNDRVFVDSSYENPVPVGSFITNINGMSVVDQSYDQISSQIRNKGEPIILSFREPTQKKGILKQQLKTMEWKPKLFEIANGCFRFYDDEFRLEMTISLRNCHVNFCNDKRVGKLNCFQITNNTDNYVFSSMSPDDCLLWVVLIYLEIKVFTVTKNHDFYANSIKDTIFKPYSKSKITRKLSKLSKKGQEKRKSKTETNIENEYPYQKCEKLANCTSSIKAIETAAWVIGKQILHIGDSNGLNASTLLEISEDSELEQNYEEPMDSYELGVIFHQFSIEGEEKADLENIMAFMESILLFAGSKQSSLISFRKIIEGDGSKNNEIVMVSRKRFIKASKTIVDKDLIHSLRQYATRQILCF